MYRPCRKWYQRIDKRTNKKKTYKEQIETEELAKRNDLRTANADKGGVGAIMDTYSCIKEANQRLSDKVRYKQLTQDPTLHKTEWSTKQ